MLEDSFEQLYLLFRANYYREMVKSIGTRDGSLNATENFCVEIIYLMDRPTISEFAHFLRISVPNANYKINSLVEKDYVKRVASTRDKRESHLEVTDKFLRYYGLRSGFNAELMRRIRATYSKEEIEALEGTINTIIGLMREDVPQQEEQRGEQNNG